MTYWRDSLLVGNDKIDTQHKKLVLAIDDLMEACTKGQGRARVGETLHFVVEYTKEHFRDEEQLQAKHGYPTAAAHKQLHTLFINNITKLEAEYKATGPSIALTAQINKVLIDWLIKHITIEDKKVGEFLKGK